MYSQFVKKTSALLLAAALMLGAFLWLIPVRTAAAQSTSEKLVSHLINVVYDDSNSMLMENRLWWCYAKYSLEVFSAMMQDKDSMNIYFMSNGSKGPNLSNLSGDKKQQQNNITAIHNTVTYTSGTPFESIERAYGDLKKASGYDEKWMLVITDGDSFNNKEGTADLDRLIADCAANNIRVVYLAIGNALVPTENVSKGIYVYKADGQVSSGETGILSRVTQICQRIFRRPALNSRSSSQLVLDVPASEIIVFAQGANVSIGSLKGARKTSSSAAMSPSDRDKATTNPTYVNSINIDTLNATIATFVPESGGYIAEGTYDFLISADEYVIYYKPCLDVLLELYDANGTKMEAEYIPVGSYTVRYWLTYPVGHPRFGEKLAQNLFSVDYTLTCDVNGAERTLNSGNVDLKEGKTTIKVLAEYLNFSSSDASLKYVVEDFTVEEPQITLEYLQQDYRLSTLEKDNLGVLVRVAKDGKPLPAAEWERFTMSCGADRMSFKTIKNDDSTFSVYPQYYNGNRGDTATGDVPFTVTVSASNDHRLTDSGTVTGQIHVEDDISAVPLGVTISDQSKSLNNKPFDEKDADRKVTVDWNGKYLTREQYDGLTLSAEIDDPNYTVTVETDPYVEGAPTTATVRFALAENADGKTADPKELFGTKNFTVSARIENEGESSEGSAAGTMTIDDARSGCEKVYDLLPFLICSGVLLFLALAYLPLIKKYLPRKSKYYYDEEGGCREIKWYNAGTTASILFPFVPVRSSVTAARCEPSVHLEVVAADGSKAILKNAAELGQRGLKINGVIPTREMKVNLHNLQITTEDGAFVAKFKNR